MSEKLTGKDLDAFFAQMRCPDPCTPRHIPISGRQVDVSLFLTPAQYMASVTRHRDLLDSAHERLGNHGNPYQT